MSAQIAALFCDPAGSYSGLPDVDLWDEARDARLYAGPWPVVAHPPCARWSRLAGFVEFIHGYKQGDDDGCFESALASVRRYGGVLEHPAHTKAWRHYGLPLPTVRIGWTLDMDGGASCYVEQGRYGLPVKKATWLYAYGCDLPQLKWGYTPDRKGPALEGREGMDIWRDSWAPRGWCLNQHRDGDAARVTAAEGRMRGARASTTPPEFRDVLLAMARSAAQVAA